MIIRHVIERIRSRNVGCSKSGYKAVGYEQDHSDDSGTADVNTDWPNLDDHLKLRTQFWTGGARGGTLSERV